jgi:DNA-binding NarL/FixJ family response regulator
MPRSGSVLVGTAARFVEVLDGLAHLVGTGGAEFVVQGPLDEVAAGIHLDLVVLDTFGMALDSTTSAFAFRQLAQRGPLAVLAHDLHPALVERVTECGGRGVIAKSLPAGEMIDSFRQLASGWRGTAGPTVSLPASSVLRWPAMEAGLSERESHVLALVADGLSNREVAEALWLSPETVKAYVRRLFSKLGLRNRVEAAGFVHQSPGFRPSASVPLASPASRGSSTGGLWP